MPRETWSEDVLVQLDRAQAEYRLTGPGNPRFPSAALRLSAFTSEEEWLLVIQSLAWSARGGGFVVDLQAFGSNVAEADREGSEPILDELWAADGTFLADPHDFTVRIAGEACRYRPSSSEYQTLGIDLSRTPKALAVLRWISERDTDRLLLTPQQIVARHRKDSLELLFTLDEWQHPDEAEDQPPSEVPCFKCIAQCIQERSARGLAVCREGSNTDWRRWVELEDRLRSLPK